MVLTPKQSYAVLTTIPIHSSLTIGISSTYKFYCSTFGGLYNLSLTNKQIIFYYFATMNGEILSADMDESTKMKWYKIVFGLKKQFGKKPDMNALLFLIGMNEVGQVREYAKDEKMDLMHVATCRLLAYEGYYELKEYDGDGWPHYRQTGKPPYGDLTKQETLLKRLIVKYFEENNLLEGI